MHDDLLLLFFLIEKFLCNANRKKALSAFSGKSWVVTKFLPFFIPNFSPFLIG